MKYLYLRSNLLKHETTDSRFSLHIKTKIIRFHLGREIFLITTEND
jgi:hypothetical protein